MGPSGAQQQPFPQQLEPQQLAALAHNEVDANSRLPIARTIFQWSFILGRGYHLNASIEA
jgi:hypothetical protein